MHQGFQNTQEKESWHFVPALTSALGVTATIKRPKTKTNNQLHLVGKFNNQYIYDLHSRTYIVPQRCELIHYFRAQSIWPHDNDN